MYLIGSFAIVKLNNVPQNGFGIDNKLIFINFS